MLLIILLKCHTVTASVKSLSAHHPIFLLTNVKYNCKVTSFINSLLRLPILNTDISQAMRLVHNKYFVNCHASMDE